MKRMAAVVASVAVAGLTASPALADQGSPGTTFPEQPGGNVVAGCTALVEESSAIGFPPRDPTAGAIIGAVYTDACLGG